MTDDRLAFHVLIPVPAPPIDHVERAAVAVAFERQQSAAARALLEVMVSIRWSEADVRAERGGRG